MDHWHSARQDEVVRSMYSIAARELTVAAAASAVLTSSFYLRTKISLENARIERMKRQKRRSENKRGRKEGREKRCMFQDEEKGK